MKSSEMEAQLYCIHCNNNTPHVITYINEKMKHIECEECHNTIEFKVDIMKELYKEVYDRISTKPSRITEEYKQGLDEFLAKIPIRVISKPYRLIRYLNQSYKTIKQYKK